MAYAPFQTGLTSTERILLEPLADPSAGPEAAAALVDHADRNNWVWSGGLDALEVSGRWPAGPGRHIRLKRLDLWVRTRSVAELRPLFSFRAQVLRRQIAASASDLSSAMLRLLFRDPETALGFASNQHMGADLHRSVVHHALTNLACRRGLPAEQTDPYGPAPTSTLLSRLAGDGFPALPTDAVPRLLSLIPPLGPFGLPKDCVASRVRAQALSVGCAWVGSMTDAQALRLYNSNPTKWMAARLATTRSTPAGLFALLIREDPNPNWLARAAFTAARHMDPRVRAAVFESGDEAAAHRLVDAVPVDLALTVAAEAAESCPGAAAHALSRAPHGSVTREQLFPYLQSSHRPLRLAAQLALPQAAA